MRQNTTSGSTPSYPIPGHIPELDGTRGIAILLVLLFHCAKSVFGFGWMGVDLFFVLSGYLITAGLVRTAGAPNYFRNFYTKRLLRIIPVYYLLVFIVFVSMPALGGREPHAPGEWLIYVLFLQNLLHPLVVPSGLGQAWSLAVEEHFYLLWPFVVARLSKRGILSFGLALIVLAPLTRIALTLAHGPAWRIYYLTPCRVDALAAGAVLALVLAEPRLTAQRARRWAAAAGLGAGSLAIPLAFWFGADVVNGTLPNPHPFALIALLSLSALAGTGAVAYAISARSSWIASWLRASWLRYIGKISYGIYLYHALVFATVASWFESETLPPYLKLVRAALQVGSSVLLATASWYIVERPILKWKSRLAPEATPLSASRA